jgi:hypothetical protein
MDSVIVDTVVQKPFTTVVTHNVIFARRDYWNWGNDFLGNPGALEDETGSEQNGETNLYRRAWKIIAVSLVEGGTGSPNILITKLSLTLPDGREIVIESPNDFFLYRILGRPDQVPAISSGEYVVLKVELQSAYADPDFVSLTFGALRDRRFNRQKRLLELISEEFDGQFYTRTYQIEWVPRNDRGPKHAVVDAMPKQVVFDDGTEVEAHSWGTPYIIR